MIGSHKTTIEPTPAGALRVVYHQTAVAVRDAQGLITLNSDGWRTATTKKRMNQALEAWGSSWRVFQKDGGWFVRHTSTGRIVTFSDCMVTT